MVNVTEKHLDEINAWRVQLLKEIDELNSKHEANKKELELLDIKSNILANASERLSQNEKEKFWKTHGEPIEIKYSKALEEFDENRKLNYKEQREIQTILSVIEDFLKRNEYKY